MYVLAPREDQITLKTKTVKMMESDHPLVSIIIPARNEENHLPKCLASLKKLDYPNYEVLVIDDHSTDQTRAVAESATVEYSNFKIASSQDLPSDWTGKNWSNYQGANASEGEWLLFTDADTEFYPQALSASVAYAQEENLDMLTLMPRLDMVAFWDKVTLPLIGGLVMVLCPLIKVNTPSSPVAGAVGAFILIRRRVYEALGGHAAIRGKIVDDREFAILVKSAGYKLRLLNGAQIYQVRMYDNFEDLWEGWSKNLFLGMDNSCIKAAGAIIGIFLLTVFPFLALAEWFLYNWGSWGTGSGLESFVPVTNMVIIGINIYLHRMFKSNFSAAYGLSLPLGGITVIGIIVNSIFRYHRGISWKGRKYHKGLRIS